MIDGFKNREVICEPLCFTADLLPGDLRSEYLQTGAISLPYVEPLERPRDDFMSRDWDARDGKSNLDPADELMDYLDWLDSTDEEDEEGGWL